MTIRLGILAASRIARSAVVEAAPLVAGVEVTAIGARELGRARAAAERWGIPLAVGSYAELVAADTVDAVYIGTPASLHRPWAMAAIATGKHVLCEKPFAANAEDARRIAEAGRLGDRVVMEAYHWRYHPMAGQVRRVLDSGVLGEVARIEAAFEIADGHIPRSDIRWDLALGGGATMDLGCYPIQWARFAAGADPEVVWAEAVCPVPGIDGSLTAELRWASGATGRIASSMIAEGEGATSWLRVTGTAGHLLASNPLAPQNGGASLVVETSDGTTTYDIDPSPTYVHQLAAFRDAIVDGAPFPTTSDDGVLTMAIVDACYRAAGLDPRPAAD